MRAEGVLRLILNVAMFPGMSFEVTDKYVRTVVFEDGQSRSLLIRVSLGRSRRIELLSHILTLGRVRADCVVQDGPRVARQATTIRSQG